jgi:hypothetical protein
VVTLTRPILRAAFAVDKRLAEGEHAFIQPSRYPISWAQHRDALEDVRK